MDIARRGGVPSLQQEKRLVVFAIWLYCGVHVLLFQRKHNSKSWRNYMFAILG
jgi:hypothetical protein